MPLPGMMHVFMIVMISFVDVINVITLSLINIHISSAFFFHFLTVIAIIITPVITTTCFFLRLLSKSLFITKKRVKDCTKCVRVNTTISPSPPLPTNPLILPPSHCFNSLPLFFRIPFPLALPPFAHPQSLPLPILKSLHIDSLIPFPDTHISALP